MIEMAVVLAIVAIIAATAVFTMRAAARNASVQGAAAVLAKKFDDALRLQAMRDGRDILAIVVDAGNVRQCAQGDDRECAMLHLVEPLPGFFLNAFDPSMPFANANAIDRETLPNGIRFHRALDGTLVDRAAPRPFDAIRTFNPALLATCGGRRCMGVRFHSDGAVDPEYPTSTVGAPQVGMAFALGSELVTETRGTDQRGVFVTFPTGIARDFPISQ
jgi:hypothetical protein